MKEKRGNNIMKEKSKATMLYKEMKDKHSKEYDNFSKDKVFYAFSDDQFKEGMQKLHLDADKDEDLKKIVHFFSGCYALKSEAKNLENLLASFTEEQKKLIEEDTTGDGFIYSMFKYELANHEYGYTYDLEDTLEALSLTYEEVQEKPNLKKGLEKALAEYKEEYE